MKQTTKQVLLFCLLLSACTRALSSSAGLCLEVTLTGTKGGPNVYEGLAGPGTLVTFGTVANQCRDVLMLDGGPPYALPKWMLWQATSMLFF
jgi:hypothetical protein